MCSSKAALPVAPGVGRNRGDLCKEHRHGDGGIQSTLRAGECGVEKNPRVDAGPEDRELSRDAWQTGPAALVCQLRRERRACAGRGVSFPGLLLFPVRRAARARARADDVAAGGRLPFPDSVTAQIEFADGSCGQLVYSAEGDSGFPKEALTVYAAGLVAEITNFQELVVHRGRKRKSIHFHPRAMLKKWPPGRSFCAGRRGIRCRTKITCRHATHVRGAGIDPRGRLGGGGDTACLRRARGTLRGQAARGACISDAADDELREVSRSSTLQEWIFQP